MNSTRYAQHREHRYDKCVAQYAKADTETLEEIRLLTTLLLTTAKTAPNLNRWI